MIYLDNNANTMMPKESIEALISFLNVGNPSAHHTGGKCKKLMDTFKKEIAAVLKFSLEEYEVIFNSGASESNNHIVNSVVKSYTSIKKAIPHIIISGVEHKSMYECVCELGKLGLLTYTELPSVMRSVSKDELNAAIKPNTALVAIMGANNETGIVNNLKELREIAYANNIPFYSDTVQMIGKYPFDVSSNQVDAFCMSFHKIHGPIGCGVLVIRKSLLSGYKLCAHVCGAQNNSLRGGTENIAGIAGSLVGFRYSMSGMIEKIRFMAHLRAKLLQGIRSNFITAYVEDNKYIQGSIVFIAPRDFKGTLPNTILLTVCRPNICNKALRNGLEAHGFIIGLGSACSQDEPTKLGENIQYSDGIIRISLSFENTDAEIDKFIGVFTKLAKSDAVLKK